MRRIVWHVLVVWLSPTPFTHKYEAKLLTSQAFIKTWKNESILFGENRPKVCDSILTDTKILRARASVFSLLNTRAILHYEHLNNSFHPPYLPRRRAESWKSDAQHSIIWILQHKAHTLSVYVCSMCNVELCVWAQGNGRVHTTIVCCAFIIYCEHFWWEHRQRAGRMSVSLCVVLCVRYRVIRRRNVKPSNAEGNQRMRMLCMHTHTRPALGYQCLCALVWLGLGGCSPCSPIINRPTLWPNINVFVCMQPNVEFRYMIRIGWWTFSRVRCLCVSVSTAVTAQSA